MKNNKSMIVVTILMMVAAFARLIPHVPNFTPTEGITIFGAAYLGKKYLPYILPILLIYVTDFIINNTIARPYFTNTEGIVWFSDYMLYGALSLILIVGISKYILKKVNIKNIVIASLISSVIFFLISNFGAWVGSKTFYSADLSGLLQSYIAGIPFFRTSILSSLFFSLVIFGSYEIILKIIAARKESEVAE